jgi:CarD family transcriptional regulator
MKATVEETAPQAAVPVASKPKPARARTAAVKTPAPTVEPPDQAVPKPPASAKSAPKPSPEIEAAVTKPKTIQAGPAEATAMPGMAEGQAPLVPAASVAAPAPAPVAAPPAEPRPVQSPQQNGRPMAPVRTISKEEIYIEGDYVVYPTHGVGKVEKIAVEDIAGHRLELIHITFEENRMTLRVPVSKARTAGLRKLASRKMFDEALAVLKGRARIKRTMWSRRAQEYEAKINSGDPIAIAEVVRDLHRNAGQPDQSFSERQIYEAAMDRLAAELAAIDQTDKLAASIKLANFLKTI